MGANLLRRIAGEPSIVNRFDKIVLVDPLQYGTQKISDTILRDPRYEFVSGSIYEPRIVASVVGEADIVIHLAAEINSFTEPQAKSADDAIGYLETLADRHIGRLLFLSTADVYGVNDSPDLQEGDLIRPTTIYAAAKAAFEAYLFAFHSLRHLPIVIFRPVTIYGPDQYPGWLIPRAITQAVRGEQISITGDGSARRDWIFVADVCELLVKAALHHDADVHGEVFNVGTGEEEEVLSVTHHVLERVGGSESLITFVPARPGDIPRQITHADKARRVFEWAPVTSLHDGLDATIAWYQQQARRS